MKIKTFHVGLMVLLVTALPSAEKPEKIEANLTGYEEVPSVSTPASGRFKATISSDGTDDRVRALVQPPCWNRPAVPHPLRPKGGERQRRHLVVPDHDDASAGFGCRAETVLSAVGQGQRHHHERQRGRRRHGVAADFGR